MLGGGIGEHEATAVFGVQEDSRANVHDGKPGPVEHLLRQEMQPLMVGLARAERVHLGHGHLGDGDERIQVPFDWEK